MAGSDLGSRPRHDEVEVSVFGPGYGECIVLHVANDQWVIIDSCVGPLSQQSSAIEYLAALNIDVAAKVRLVLATHYHDDHICGIAGAFEKCKAARFACSMALNLPDWTKLVEIYRNYLIGGGPGVDELRRVMQELRARGQAKEIVSPIFCIAGRVFAEPILMPPAEVICLSPSDAAVGAMHTRIRERLLPQAERRRLAVPSLESNDGSVAISVRVGSASALLGADLEERNRPGLGWQVVLDDWPDNADQHDGFKIPHHGSVTGYHPDAWNRLVKSNGWAVVTPYNRQKEPIPRSSDCERILRMSSRSFITSPPGWSRFRHSDRAVQKTAEEATLRIGAEQPKHGHIRLRRSIAAGAEWRVELFGQAQPLSALRIAA